MPKSRVYKCTKCSRSHERPTGKNCRWVAEDIPTPTQTDGVQPGELTAAINNLTTTMAAMGQRMLTMEKRLDEKTTTEVVLENSVSDDEIAQSAPVSPAHREVPSVRDLRNNIDVGREVDRRLAELEEEDDATGQRLSSVRIRGKRSGAARTVKDTVINDIDWPHFHIYTSPGADAMTFDRLTIPEFVYGFLHMIDQPDARLDRAVMWDILKGMMEDATEYPWHNVRDFYWVVGSHVENDRLSWTDNVPIQKLRAKHAQKHSISPKKQGTTSTRQQKLRYCGLFQTGNCPEKADHDGQKHMCAYCYKARGTPYSHPESECRRKSGEDQPKNGAGGE